MRKPSSFGYFYSIYRKRRNASASGGKFLSMLPSAFAARRFAVIALFFLRLFCFRHARSIARICLSPVVH